MATRTLIFLSLLFLSAPLFAEGPIYEQSEEWTNVYHDIRTLDATVSSNTASILSIQANPASSGAVFQVVGSSNAVRILTTSASFVDTNLNVSITPTDSSHRVLVCATGSFAPAASALRATMTIARDGTSLCGAAGCGTAYVAATAPLEVPWAACFLDSPATTSAVNYRARIKSDGANTSVFLNASDTGTIFAMEVQ